MTRHESRVRNPTHLSHLYCKFALHVNELPYSPELKQLTAQYNAKHGEKCPESRIWKSLKTLSLEGKLPWVQP